MKILDFPGCCTVKVITGFGQSLTADYNHRPSGKVTQKDIEDYLKERIATYKNYAAFVATTTDEQTNANAALLACGFVASPQLEKGNHKQTKLTVWWLGIKEHPLNQPMKVAVDDKQLPKRDANGRFAKVTK